MGGNAPPQQSAIAYYVDEWPFPAIQSVGSSATIIGSSPPRTLPASFAPGQPPGTSSTGTCSWHFIRGGTAPPPTPSPGAPSQRVGMKPESPAPNNPTSSASLPVTRAGGSAQNPPSPPQPTTTVAPGGQARNSAQPPSSDPPSRKTGPAPVNVLYLFKTVQKEGQACVVQIGIKWTPAPEATGYTVYVSDSADGAYRAAALGVVVPVWSTRRRIEVDATGTLFVRIGASFDRMREGVTATRAVTYTCSGSSPGWRS
jgi:hypothetical protein